MMASLSQESRAKQNKFWQHHQIHAADNHTICNLHDNDVIPHLHDFLNMVSDHCTPISMDLPLLSIPALDLQSPFNICAALLHVCEYLIRPIRSNICWLHRTTLLHQPITLHSVLCIQFATASSFTVSLYCEHDLAIFTPTNKFR